MQRAVFCITFLAVLFSHPFLPGQSISRQVVASAGADLSGGGVQLSWTLGEPLAGDLSGGGLLLQQGFQQGDLVVVPNAATGLFLEFGVKAFPVPTSGRLELQRPDLTTAGDWEVDVVSMAGRRLQPPVIWPAGAPQLALDLSAYPSGTYLVRLRDRASRRSGIVQVLKLDR